MTELFIQGVSTAIPIIVVTLGVLNKFKNDLCEKISSLDVKISTHIEIAKKQDQDFERLQDDFTHLLRKNKLKT